MSVESTRAVMDRFFSAEHSDTSMMADDVVFTIMGTGEKYKGAEAVLGMLDYFYRGAFEATAETRNLIVSDNHAVLEADFVGKHIGDFAGIPATHKDVRVPLCVIYDVEGDAITQGRVYMEMPVMLSQLGVQAG